MLIDSHAHLQDDDLLPDLAGVLDRAGRAGVEKIICVGYDLKSSRQAADLARKHKQVYAVVGVHPHDASTYDDRAEQALTALCQDAKVVAIGEIGLDYYRNLSPQDVQRDVFVRQIQLAQRLRKPIVIHDRDAHEDVLRIIKAHKAGKFGGVMHCYSGRLPMALELIKENFYLSFAGPVTYKNNQKGQEVAAKIPPERLLIETDCPYLTPEPHRGKRNEPANVAYVAEKIAALRGKTTEEIAYISNRNAHQAFRLP
jgi:TatD DNase family protein